MRILQSVFFTALAALLLGTSATARVPQPFTLEQGTAFPTTDLLVTASSGARIAWVFEERGVRNVWGAEAPAWDPRQLTQFDTDDGMEITQLAFSDNGSALVFVRNADGGNWAPSDGVHANPLGLPVAQKIEIWTALFKDGSAHRLAEGDAPAISPSGDRVAFIRDGQAFVAEVGGTNVQSLFFARGRTQELTWAPDGSKLVFVSNRGSHSLLGVFRSAKEPIQWLAPSSNHLVSPRWSPDGKQIAFIKRPGSGGDVLTFLDRHPDPFELWVADIASGNAHAAWKSPRTIAGSFPSTLGEANLAWGAGGRLVFTAHLDGWPHLYSVPATGGEPLLLTPGPFMVEYVSMSADRRTIVYNANTGVDADDDDRRHLYRVSVDRANPQPLTSGKGIEWNPVVTGDGQSIAFIGSGVHQPQLPAVISASGGKARTLLLDRVPAEFAGSRFVEPRKVTFRASDGLTIHGQLFQSSAAAAGKRPAVIFVHGGPQRQMLLGFHYMGYYAHDYAMNQYLANRGFVVLSVNFRLGIGYGDAFNHPPAAGEKGASEYLDVLAGAKYLQSRPEVDAKRIGIWGGSYGGYLTALALARNSDIFAAGVDLHGVHHNPNMMAQEGYSPAGQWLQYERPSDYLKALELAWQSSPVADVDRWRSPVLFIHGDDDRNVDVSQTVDLVERLRARNVRFEELIIPDETHDWKLGRTWSKVSRAAAEFLIRELGPLPPAP